MLKYPLLYPFMIELSYTPWLSLIIYRAGQVSLPDSFHALSVRFGSRLAHFPDLNIKVYVLNVLNMHYELLRNLSVQSFLATEL